VIARHDREIRVIDSHGVHAARDGCGSGDIGKKCHE
jgi:hypothetical protein